MALSTRLLSYMERAGFDRGLLRKTMEDYTVSNEEDGAKARHVIGQYVKDAVNMVSSGTGILLAGRTGVGKTMLLTILAYRLLEMQLVKPLLVDCNDLIMSTNAMWVREAAEGTRHTFDHILRAELLLIDNVPFKLNQSRDVFPIIEKILRHRNSRDLPTFITYGKLLSDLKREADERTLSLINEKLLVVGLKSLKDRRSENQREIHRKFKIGEME